MRAEIDQSGCISCGLCVNTCPEVFAFDDSQKAQVMQNPIPPTQEDCTREAAGACPVSVISLIE